MVDRRDIHGILLLDKPKGITSNVALQKVKRLFKARKAGHTGSLDPIATGLLPICFGKATKISQCLLEADKHYQTVARLGIRTETGDTEGNILSEATPPLYSLAHLEDILEQFRGDILQIPPMYSAIKHQGQPLYKLARQGIEIERPARPASIYVLNILEWKNPFLSLEIRVSKGTYIRTLVDDLGQALGCGAHVVELRRVGAGKYSEDQMISFEYLQKVAEEGGVQKLDDYLLSWEVF